MSDADAPRYRREAEECSCLAAKAVDPIQNGLRGVCDTDGSYFLRMPVSVLPKLFVALLAAGVSTALSCEVGP